MKSDTLILQSKPYTDKVIGFAGPTPLEIVLDASGKISEVKLLPNKDTPKYIQIAIDGGLLKAWNGLTPQEALAKKVDAVSGATFTSRGIINTVHKRLEVYEAEQSRSDVSLLAVTGTGLLIIIALGYICGPVLGAALIVATDMSIVMLLDVAGAVIACTALLFVFIPNPEKTETDTADNVLRDMKAGFNVISRNRGLSWVMVIEVLITFFVMPIVALLPLMTLKNFSGTAYQVSLIELLFGLGMLLGGILLGIWNPRVRKVVMMNVSYVIIGVSIFISGILPPSAFIAYAIFSVVQGLAIPFNSGPFTALLQTKIEASFLGRVFSLFDSISLLPSILGLMATGFIADAIGVANVFAICGIAIVLTGTLAFFIPSIMKLERRE